MREIVPFLEPGGERAPGLPTVRAAPSLARYECEVSRFAADLMSAFYVQTCQVSSTGSRA